jgi:hypothetical protein
MSSNIQLHIQDEDSLELRLREHTGDSQGHYLTLDMTDASLTIHVPTSRAYEVAILLNKAAVYFGGVGLSRGTLQ